MGRQTLSPLCKPLSVSLVPGAAFCHFQSSISPRILFSSFAKSPVIASVAISSLFSGPGFPFSSNVGVCWEKIKITSDLFPLTRQFTRFVYTCIINPPSNQPYRGRNYALSRWRTCNIAGRAHLSLRNTRSRLLFVVPRHPPKSKAV